MIRTSTIGALSLAAASVAALVLGSAALSQPTSRSPLAPPPNGPRKSDPADGYVALTGATVHVRPGVTLDNATVVMRGGTIESVTPIDNTTGGRLPVPPVPAGAEERDCAGMHIYAGFLEPYFEVDVPKPDPNAPGSHWNPRVTPQRTALDQGASGILPKDAETLRSMGFVGAAISPRGGIFRGSSAMVSLAQPSGDPSAAPPRVYADGVYQSLSLSPRDDDGPPVRAGPRQSEEGRWNNYPSSQMGAIALIRQTLSDADWQQNRRVNVAGAESMEALDALRRHQTEAKGTGADAPHDPGTLMFDVADELELLRAAKIASEFRRPAMILGSGMEFRRLEAIAASKLPIILPLNYPKAPKVGGIGEADAVDLKELINWEQAPTSPRRLDAAGQIMALTTSKVPDKLGGRRVFREHLSSAIKHGLKPESALAMLTENPARILGVSDRFGRVEKGMAASLIVADGELFTDRPDAPKKGEPGHVRPGRIIDVWIDGRRHPIAPKQRRDLGGTWDITLTPGPQAGSNLKITFEIDDDFPPTITIVKRSTDDAGKEDKATTKCQGVSIEEDGRLRFTFDHEPFGEKGVFVSSGVIEKGDDGQPVVRGESIRAGGQLLRWSAVRVSTEIPKKEAKGHSAKGTKEKAEGDEGERGDKDNKDTKPRADELPVPPNTDDTGKDESRKSKTPEADAIAVIPENLGLPLGAYAVPELPKQERVLLRHATVWTAGEKGVLEDAVVMFDEGKIWFVGTEKEWHFFVASAKMKGGFRDIDCSGKHVTPGIIDCHSHTGISKGVNEGGQAVTAEVRIGDVTDPDSISWYRQLAAGVTTVNSLHGSANPIGGQNQVNKIRWGCTSPDDTHFAGAIPGIKFALGENVKQSNGDRQSTRYPVSRMGVETIIRDRFTAAREYAAAGPGEGRRRDLELEALAEILEGKRLIHCHSYRQDEILMLCRIADEFGFKIGTFQHGLEVYKVADIVRDHIVPGGGASLFADWWAYKVEVQDAIPYAGPMQTEVGVLTSYNSDSDEMSRRLNVEAGKAAKYSHGHLTDADALKFVTINPARQLHIDDRVGSLEAGKDADLAIWSGPPLSSLSRCERTFVDGREMFSLEKDAQLRRANQSERARIIQKILASKGDGPGRGKKGEGDEPPAPGPDAGKPTDEYADAGDSTATSGRRSILLDAYRAADDARREYFLDLLRRGLDPRFHAAGECGCNGN
ncbi:MAG TPA: amidohydrolase family protein [Phycisphaerales bacterium]|nr:amidohydrolase family protein [Phycisphaerales bacterium]